MKKPLPLSACAVPRRGGFCGFRAMRYSAAVCSSAFPLVVGRRAALSSVAPYLPARFPRTPSRVFPGAHGYTGRQHGGKRPTAWGVTPRQCRPPFLLTSRLPGVLAAVVVGTFTDEEESGSFAVRSAVVVSFG